MKSFKSGLFLLILVTSSLFAQEYPKRDYSNTESEKLKIGFSYYHPAIKIRDYSLNIISGIYEFSFEAPFWNRISLFGNLPISCYANTDFSGTISGFGNLSAGIKFISSSNRNNFFKTGYTFSLISDERGAVNANLLSAESRIYELQKYINNNTIFVEAEGKHFFDNLMYIGGGAGLKFVMIHSKHSTIHDNELFLPFNIFFGYEKEESIGVSAGFAGIYYLTSNSNNTGDNIMDLIRLNFKYTGRTVQPGLILEFPINRDYKKVMDFMAGLNVAFIIR